MTRPGMDPDSIPPDELQRYRRPLKAAISQLQRLARERRDRFDMTDAQTLLELIGALEQLRARIGDGK